MRYAGRPPRVMFAYDTSCRSDCFSLPAEKGCHPECKDIEVQKPAGLLIDDRSLVLADAQSLGEPLALLFTFGFVDEAGGEAPANWGFVAAGERSYVADNLVGTARFVMEALVAEVSFTNERLAIGTVTGEAARAISARLEVTEASQERLAARFFLGFASATGQLQGEVLGCFDLTLGPAEVVGASVMRTLSP